MASCYPGSDGACARRGAEERGPRMRFGAFLPTYWDDYGATPSPVTIAEAATAAAALGYEGVWANDNVVRPAAAQRGTIEGCQVVESLVALASLVHLVPRL